MKQYTVNNIERAFKELLIAEDKISEGYCIIVQTTDNWEFPLPEELVKKDFMKVDIKNWAREQSYIDDLGIHIITAFGEDENSKFFSFSDIIGLYNFEDEQIFIKPYIPKNEKENVTQPLPEPETKHSLHSIMHPDTEGLKHSQSKLSLVRQKTKEKTKEKKEKLSKKKKKKNKKEK